MAPRPSDRRDPDRGRSDALWDLLRDCHRGIRAELRDVVGKRGLYLSEYRALGALRDGPRTPSEISERLGLTPAATTDLSNQLLGRGWVSRRPHPTDGRSHLLRVSPAGAVAFARARREYRARLATVYGELSPRDRRALGEGLAGLAAVLDRLRDDAFRRAPGTRVSSSMAERDGAPLPIVRPETPRRRRAGRTRRARAR